jgi:signal transduction histidine kinase
MESRADVPVHVLGDAELAELAAQLGDPALGGPFRILRAIALGRPLPEVLDLLVRTIERATTGMRASVLLLDDDGTRLRHGAAPSLPDRYNEAIDGITIGPLVGSCGTAAYLNEPVVVTNVVTDPRWHDFVDLVVDTGAQACWSTPIRDHDGAVLGTFAMYYDDVRAPGVQEQRLIDLATDLASIAILRERGRALEATQRELDLAAAHVARLQGLSRSAVVINSRASIGEMLSTITEQACAIIGAHQGSTSLTEPGTGVDEGFPQQAIAVWLSDKYAAWRDYEAPSRGARSYALVCAGNDVVRMTDEELRAHPAWAGFGTEADRHPPMRGWLAAPLVASDGSNLGMIQLSDRSAGEFDEADEATLVQLAQMASVAVEKARLDELAADRDRQRLREELLAGLSHDMQTPLATITGLVDWLSRTVDTDDPLLAQGLETLGRQTDNLYALVQQFLDYSRLQAGRPLAVGRSPVDVADAVRRVVTLYDHHREIRVELTRGALRTSADQLRLQQVLSNLLSNAIKFTDGPIVLRGEACDERVAVHVDDQGPGIPDAERASVFERFYRGGRASGTPGTGLGLYISREVLRAMGGELTATTSPEGGARFTLVLPGETTPKGGR